MAITIGYTPSSLRQYKKLDSVLRKEVKLKIEEFTDRKSHEGLGVHKLHGKQKDCLSFNVDYENRVVFMYKNQNEAILLAVGDHDIYK